MRKILTTTFAITLLHIAAFSQCNTLNLTVDKTHQCAPGTLNFQLTGAPVGSKYIWDFGEGPSQHSDTVYKFYVNPTVVSVTVAVTFPNGQTCNITKTNISEILPKPQPSFEISRKKLCDGPDTVTLINTTPNTASISWVVDGTNYFESTNKLIHRFKTPGTKNLNMVIRDNYGCTNVSEFRDVAVVHPDVTVDFVADQRSGCVTKSVEFAPVVTSNGEEIVKTLWEFPKTSLGKFNGKNPPKITYSKPGKYNASLAVTTSNGCTHKTVKNNYLAFGDSIKLDVRVGNQILCRKNASELEIRNPIADGKYTWVLGGSPDTTMLTKTKVRTEYPSAGEFDVTVLLDYAGCYSQISLKEAVKVKDLEAKFASSDHYHCKVPHTTNLVNKSTSYNNSKLSYRWYVYAEDSTLVHYSIGKNLKFTSSDWGRFSVRMIATDQFGCADTAEYRNYIRIDSIRPAMTSAERIGCVNQLITLNSVTPASSYISSDSFCWVVYDLDGTSIYNKGKGRSIKQSFSKPGLYDVKLYAGNLIGCIDSLERKSYIHIVEPKKSFEIGNDVLCKDETVELKATTTPRFAPFKFSYQLIHEDGKTVINLGDDTDSIRKRKLNLPGEYGVRYSHKIANGCFDTITKPASIHVNTIHGSISLDVNDGCLPLTVKPSFNVSENLHYGSNSDSLEYEWYASTTQGVTLLGKGDKIPEFTFARRGSYRVYVRVTNSMGCQYTATSGLITAGVIAKFSTERDSLCANSKQALINQSQLRPDKYEWIIESNSDYDIETNSSPVWFTPKDQDLYTIKLVASKNNECFDTASKTVQSIVVTSDFQVADTHLFCAPAYAQFNTLSVGADTFIWDFGEGTMLKTTDKHVANIYYRNSGYDQGFDVTLTSKSYLGCEDVIVKPGIVKVFGPVPEFSLKNYKGCEPLEVEFVNESHSVANFFLNFDDASPLDSTSFTYHTYKVKTTAMEQSFLPTLYIVDSLGCAAVAESKDTVTVLRSPVAIPSETEIEGCSPVQVALTDQSQNISTRRWLLDSVELSTQVGFDPSISNPGIHLVQLEVTNTNLCADTANIPVTVNGVPKVSFEVQNRPCIKQDINVKVNVEAYAPIKHYVWIEDADVIDTVYSPEFTMTFKSSGDKDVSVIAEDIVGCKDEFSSIVELKGPADIPNAEITHVTVNNQNEVEVYWTSIDPGYVNHTSLIDNNTNTALYQGEPNAQTNANLGHYSSAGKSCYTLMHTSLCGEEGNLADPHCPIVLTVTVKDTFALQLDWTPYGGWSTISEYDVLRSSDGKIFEKIATVNGDITTYTDKLLCEQTYTYRIRTSNKSHTSHSNFASDKPFYVTDRLPLDVVTATVENNEYVKVEWNPAQFEHTNHYVISKYDPITMDLLESNELDQTEYIDDMVNVASENFIYEVRTADHCHVEGPAGYHGKPMVLEGFYSNNMSHLSWTAYEEWDEGVARYSIQLLVNGEFQTIATVNGSQTAYIDKEFHDEVNEYYIFRIVASTHDSTVTSVSNEIKLAGESIVWIPNAFSPNDDGHNPIFRPTPQFVYLVNDGTYREYEMKIFNRWGEELFQTNNIEEGWDGTYRNKPCESEAYMYHIRVTGLDREIYDKKGMVRLMR